MTKSHINVFYTDYNSQLLVSSKTYVIREFRGDLIQNDDGYWPEPLGSRVDWQELIVGTFATSGKKLLDAHDHLGLLLGSVARIFDAIGHSEPLLAQFIPNSLSDPMSLTGRGLRSFGQALVSFMLIRLPELRTLKDIITGCLYNDLKETFKIFHHAVHQIMTLCGCGICLRNLKTTSDEHEGSFCLAGLASSLIRILHDLSLVNLHVDLAPYRSGILLIYDEIMGRSGWPDPLHLREILAQFPSERIFSTAQAIYTGFRSTQRSAYWDKVSATSIRGIVLYLGILERMSDNAEDSVKISIVPGIITYDHSDRQIDCLLDDPSYFLRDASPHR